MIPCEDLVCKYFYFTLNAQLLCYGKIEYIPFLHKTAGILTITLKPKIISFVLEFDAYYILPRKLFICMQERLEF